MLNATQLRSGPVCVVDYRCTAEPAEKPFTELHRTHSVSYVRKGTFGYRARGLQPQLLRGVSARSGWQQCGGRVHEISVYQLERLMAYNLIKGGHECYEGAVCAATFGMR